MITTLIILNLLAKFGIIKQGSILHPEQVLIQSKRFFSWFKGQFNAHESTPILNLLNIKKQQ